MGDQLPLLASVFVLVFVTLVVAGVILLRPLSGRLALLLEAMARERSKPGALDDVRHVRTLLETLEGRVALLEERQDFTDALLGGVERARMAPPPGETPEARE